MEEKEEEVMKEKIQFIIILISSDFYILFVLVITLGFNVD